MAPWPKFIWPFPEMGPIRSMYNIYLGRTWRKHGKCWSEVDISTCVGKKYLFEAQSRGLWKNDCAMNVILKKLKWNANSSELYIYDIAGNLVNLVPYGAIIIIIFWVRISVWAFHSINKIKQQILTQKKLFVKNNPTQVQNFKSYSLLHLHVHLNRLFWNTISFKIERIPQQYFLFSFARKCWIIWLVIWKSSYSEVNGQWEFWHEWK